MRVSQDGQEVEISDTVHEETVHEVFEWSQWESLLNASRNGHIAEPQSTEVIFRDHDDDDDEDAEPANGFPISSDDFFPAFERTLERLQEFVQEQVVRGSRSWLERLDREITPIREELAHLLDDPELSKRLRALRLGDRGKGLVPALRAAIRPSLMESYIFPNGDPQSLELPRSHPADLFPLPRKNGAGGTSLVFAWARKFQDASEGLRPDRHCSHQSQIYRIRDEFITTISQEMTQLVGVATYKINQRVSKILEEIKGKLGVIVNRDDVLTELVRDESGGDKATARSEPDAMALVRHAAAAAWPFELGAPI